MEYFAHLIRKMEMRKYMKKVITVLFVLLFAVTGFSREMSADDLAEAVFAAHGGTKFREMKTLVVRGNADVTASVMNQAIPVTFVTIFSGDRYRLEIDNPFQPLKQVFDGERTESSVKNGFTFPPINRLGLPLLQRLGEEGFVVSALSDKKKNGFRITSPEGYFTDFYINSKTNLIKGYDASYVVNNQNVTTTVEIGKYEDKDGIFLPKKYDQRFDLGQMTVYAAFNAKEILVNTEIDDAIFKLN